jgi:hypothetical protein
VGGSAHLQGLLVSTRSRIAFLEDHKYLIIKISSA